MHDVINKNPEKRNTGLLGAAVTVIAAGLIFFGLYRASIYSYPLSHMLAELFSIIIGVGTFIMAWNTRNYMDNQPLLLIGIAYLFIAILDIAHTLAFRGMNIFAGYDSNLPTQLWLMARYLQSITLLVVPLLPRRRLNIAAFMSGLALITFALLFMAFTPGWFPDAYIEGSGLTRFKIVSEYIICLILAIALILFSRQKDRFHPRVLVNLQLSIALTILSELMFTSYFDVYDLSNLAGHGLKIAAFYLLYKAIIDTGLNQPYRLLFRDLAHSRDELKHERDFVSSVLDTVNALVIVMDSQWRVVRFNRCAEQTTGYDSREVQGKLIWELPLFAGNREKSRELFQQKQDAPESLRFEGSLFTRDRSQRHIAWTNTFLRDETESTNYIISTGIDITERKQAEERLRFLANHDILTGLYNRTFFDQEIERLAREGPLPVSVVVMDVNGLKQVNDTYGHAAGDALIRQTAELLTASFREEDLIARIGGDEFAVLLIGTDSEAAQQVQRRAEAIFASYNRAHPEMQISVAAGFATCHEGQTLNDAVRQADEAMYRQKNQR